MACIQRETTLFRTLSTTSSGVMDLYLRAASLPVDEPVAESNIRRVLPLTPDLTPYST